MQFIEENPLKLGCGAGSSQPCDVGFLTGALEQVAFVCSATKGIDSRPESSSRQRDPNSPNCPPLPRFNTRSSGNQHLFDSTQDGCSTFGGPTDHTQPPGTDPRPRRVANRRCLLQDAAPGRGFHRCRLPEAGDQQGPRNRHRDHVLGRQGAADPQAAQLQISRGRFVPRLPPRDQCGAGRPRVQLPQRVPLQYLWRDGDDRGPEHRHQHPGAEL